MTTTDEYWDVNGVSLNTFAWNIETLDGRETMMPIRGSNVVVGNRPGQQWTPKTPDARPLTLRMWVQGCDEFGFVSGDKRGIFNANWDALKRMFTTYDAPVTLRRRRRQIDGSVQQTSCSFDVTGTPSLTPGSYDYGTFSVDGVNLDAFWLDDQQVTTMYLSDLPGGLSFPLTFPIVFGTFAYTNRATVNNMGDVPVPLKMKFQGPLLNPSVQDAITGRVFKVLYDLNAADIIIADGADGSVTLNGVSRRDVIAPDAQWLIAAVGPTEYTVAAEQQESGPVTLSWRNRRL